MAKLRYYVIEAQVLTYFNPSEGYKSVDNAKEVAEWAHEEFPAIQFIVAAIDQETRENRGDKGPKRG